MQVSIIIPCYNVGKYLERCLQSALAQTYSNTEIICVDNNSTDSTTTILADYAARYPAQIRVLQEVEQGAPAARNKGLLSAKGQWIQFLDADDYLLPGKIEYQIREASRARSPHKLGFLIGDYQLRCNGRTKSWYQPEDRDLWLALFTGRSGNTCCNLWLSAALRSVDGWNNHLQSGQEYDLMFRLLKEGWEAQLSTNQQTIVEVRSESITKGANYSSSILNRFKLHLKILQWITVHEQQVYVSYREIIQAYAIKFLRDAILQHSAKAEELSEEYLNVLDFPGKLRHYEIGRAFVLFYNFFGFRIACFCYQLYVKLRQNTV